MTKILRKDLLLAYTILIFLISYLLMSLKLPFEAAIFPQIAIITTMIFTVVYIAVTIGTIKKDNNLKIRKLEKKEIIVLKRVLLIFLEIYLYVMAIDLIGFFISSIAFCIICAFTIKWGKISWGDILYIILPPTFIYIVFKYFLLVDFSIGKYWLLKF